MGVPWSLYAAHTLSTWGDNMWWFAGGCYMLELLPSSLRLTAIYGLVIAASVIVFGASVGRLVDTMGRISAARLSLAIQNLATAACALTLAAFLHYRAELEPDGPDHPTLIVSVFAITLAAVARLASCGTNIIIQKDWIVVIAGGDKQVGHHELHLEDDRVDNVRDRSRSGWLSLHPAGLWPHRPRHCGLERCLCVSRVLPAVKDLQKTSWSSFKAFQQQ